MTQEPGPQQDFSHLIERESLDKAFIETLLRWNKTYQKHYSEHPFYKNDPVAKFARALYIDRHPHSDPDRLCTNGGYGAGARIQPCLVEGGNIDFLTNSARPFPAWMQYLREAQEFFSVASKAGVING